MKKIVITLVLCLSCLLTYSQDTPLNTVIKAAIAYDDTHYFSFDLKALPNNKDFSVAAITKYNGEMSEDGFDCDLILLLIDNDTQEIIDKYIEKNKYTSDAYQLTSVSLDMANYKIADNKRAFGLRASYAAQTRVFPTWDSDLSIFVIENKKIKLLLNEFPMGKGHGEWDMNCKYDGQETETVAIMQNHKTNGYYDIMMKSVTTLRKTSAPKKESDPCLETEKKLKPTYKTLYYVKGKYQLKK